MYKRLNWSNWNNQKVSSVCSGKGQAEPSLESCLHSSPLDYLSSMEMEDWEVEDKLGRRGFCTDKTSESCLLRPVHLEMLSVVRCGQRIASPSKWATVILLDNGDRSSRFWDTDNRTYWRDKSGTCGGGMIWRTFNWSGEIDPTRTNWPKMSARSCTG